jgi:hypothetical protein
MDSKMVAEEVELIKHGYQRPLSHCQSPATINYHIQQVLPLVCPYNNIGITAQFPIPMYESPQHKTARMVDMIVWQNQCASSTQTR